MVYSSWTWKEREKACMFIVITTITVQAPVASNGNNKKTVDAVPSSATAPPPPAPMPASLFPCEPPPSVMSSSLDVPLPPDYITLERLFVTLYTVYSFHRSSDLSLNSDVLLGQVSDILGHTVSVVVLNRLKTVMKERIAVDDKGTVTLRCSLPNSADVDRYQHVVRDVVRDTSTSKPSTIATTGQFSYATKLFHIHAVMYLFPAFVSVHSIDCTLDVETMSLDDAATVVNIIKNHLDLWNSDICSGTFPPTTEMDAHAHTVDVLSDDKAASTIWGAAPCPEFTVRSAPDGGVLEMTADPSECMASVLTFPDRVSREAYYRSQIVHVHDIPSLPSNSVPTGDILPQFLVDSLSSLSKPISSLYTHQAAVWRASVDRHEHVVITTHTSSGKTLSYLLPVLNALSDGVSTALLVYPQKALSQDQLRVITEFPNIQECHPGTFDGFTDVKLRHVLNSKSRLLLVTPDILHASILPEHSKWKRLFSNLKYVVLDEVHVYRGVFGSQTADMIRRLRRVCSMYQSSPLFIGTSATIGNAAAHMKRLIGHSGVLTAIQADGAPRGHQKIVFWNPPLIRIDPEHSNSKQVEGSRSSTYIEAANVMVQLMRGGHRVLTFTKVRKTAEHVLMYVKDILRRSRNYRLLEQVACYRAGYTVQERRRIENKLFRSELFGCVATSALEIGVDTGHVDAVVLVGVPDGVSSFWQRAGRCGRAGRDGLVIVVGYDSPLDQSIFKNPSNLLEQDPEGVSCCPTNHYVLAPHLVCAAYESPLNVDVDSERLSLRHKLLSDECELLNIEGKLSLENDNYVYKNDSKQKPSLSFGLRGMEMEDQVMLYEGSRDLCSMEYSRALFEIYQDAVYLHQGVSYVVTEVDVTNNKAYLEKRIVDYYTAARDTSEVKILREHSTTDDLDDAFSDDDNDAPPPPPPSSVQIKSGTVSIRISVYGYRKVRTITSEVMDVTGITTFPPIRSTASAIWLEFPANIANICGSRMSDFSLIAGLHGIRHLGLLFVSPFVKCDINDLDATDSATAFAQPVVMWFNKRREGSGVAEYLARHNRMIKLLERAYSVVNACTCDNGCQYCLYAASFVCDCYNEALCKRSTLLLLEYCLSTKSV